MCCDTISSPVFRASRISAYVCSYMNLKRANPLLVGGGGGGVSVFFRLFGKFAESLSP
jgi:hypothetical protein